MAMRLRNQNMTTSTIKLKPADASFDGSPTKKVSTQAAEKPPSAINPGTLGTADTPPTTHMGKFGEHRFDGFVCNEDTGEVFARFALQAKNRTKLPKPVPLSVLSDRREATRLLRLQGIPTGDGTLDWVMEHAEQFEPAVTITRRGGWRGNALVNRFGELGIADPNNPFQFDRSSNLFGLAQSKGTLQGFLESDRNFMNWSSGLTCVYCTALWPALAARLGMKGGVFAIVWGPSSTGKTTLQKFGVAVGTFPDFLISFSQTEAVSTRILGAFGGSMISYADLKTCKLKGAKRAEFLQQLGFNAAEGTPHLSVDSTNLDHRPDYVVCIFTYERSLPTAFQEAGLDYEDGDACRVLDFKISGPGGIFDRLPEGMTSSNAIKQLEAALKENYGVVMPAWTKKLASIAPETLAAAHEKYSREFLGRFQGLTGVSERIGKQWANLYATGRIAAHAGLMPVDADILCQSVEKFFVQSTKGLAAVRRSEAQYVSEIRSTLAASANFPQLLANEEPEDDRADKVGFLRDEGKERILYVRLKHLRQLESASKCMNADQILDDRILQPAVEKGILLQQSGSNTTTVRQVGIPHSRYLKFRHARLLEWLKDPNA